MDGLVLCCFVLAILFVSIVSAAETQWINACLNDTTSIASVNAVNGTDTRMCLSDDNVDCKTLAYVFDNVRALNVDCLKIILKQTDTIHLLPSGAPPLSGVSLYVASEGGRAQITCPNNVESDNVTTSWSIQNADVAVFQSLTFSNCNRRLEVVNVSNVHFHDVTFSGFSDSGLRICNCFNVTLQDVTIINCSSTQQRIRVSNNVFQENSAISLVYRDSLLNISVASITNTQFINNHIKISEVENPEITSSTAIIGGFYPGRGGGLGVFINEPVNQVKVTIDNCVFINNSAGAYGGGYYLTSNGLSGGHNNTITNSLFVNNTAVVTGAGVFQGTTKTGVITEDTYFAPIDFIIDNCNFTGNEADFGGSVSFILALARIQTFDIVSISNCMFDANTATTIGSAILISSYAYVQSAEMDIPYSITDCVFTNNISPHGAVGIVFKDLDFFGENVFINNHGPSIRVADAKIGIHGVMNFTSNQVDFYAGTIFIQDFAQLQLFDDAHLYFKNNVGIITGAFSVLLHEYPRVFEQSLHNPWCFLLYEDVDRPPAQWQNVTITFENNTAYLAPNVYTSNLRLCSWQNTSEEQAFFDEAAVLDWNIFQFKGISYIIGDFTIPSDEKGIDTAAVTIIGKQEYSAFPGEQVNLSIVPYDSLGSVTAFVFGYTQFIEGSAIPIGRISRYLDLSSDENSEERVTFSSNIVEYLPGFPVRFEYRLPQNDKKLRNFTVAVYTPVTVDVSDISIIYLNITVENCPAGFILRNAEDGSRGLTCQCDYNDGSILACNLKERSVELKDGLFAVDRSNSLFSNLKVLSCPPTYCQCQRAFNSTICIARYHPMNEGLQCHPERTGNLCGACKHDHDGVGVLTPLCQRCENNIVFLVILVFVDIALIMMILFSATPFPPELKGILFYIQGMPFAISAFPLSTWRGNQIMLYISSALSLYFPWDFCLYTKMSALASNFYSYIPFFIAIIIVAVILKYRPHGYTSSTGVKFQAAYYKVRIRVAYGIWTLILLMSLRILYNALAIFNCEQVSGNGLSWYNDGTVQCFKNYRHALLFVFGIIVTLFMIFLLFFIGFLTPIYSQTYLYSTLRHLKISATYGYKVNFKWWATIELGRRYFMAFFWFSTRSTKTSLQIFAYFWMFLLYLYAQPYEKSWHNWLESFLLAYSIILLSLRSTASVSELLLPNGYTGVMLPSDIIIDNNTLLSNTSYALPPNDALTYFFVPLVYLPLLIGLVILGYLLVNWGRKVIRDLLKHCTIHKKHENERVTSSTAAVRRKRLRRHSITQVHTHSADGGFTVSSKIGEPAKTVSVTYAEY